MFGAVDRQVAAMIAEGERAGDPTFVNRRVDRNRVAAEALGCLVAGGHQAVRPTEADITVIIDADTAATGDLHDHSVCETGDGLELPPASIRRLLCTGRVTPIIVDADGTALDAGPTIRHVTGFNRARARSQTRSNRGHTKCRSRMGPGLRPDGDSALPIQRLDLKHFGSSLSRGGFGVGI